MNPLPEFNELGDLPPGVHRITLDELVRRFGATPQRAVITRRLERIHQLASSTGHLARFVIFGSFVTSKPWPNDVDIFLLMEDSFDVRQVSTEHIWFSITPQRRICWAQASFGFVVPPRSVVRRRPSPTGRPNVTETNAVSWK
jgi:hypothetical protein